MLHPDPTASSPSAASPTSDLGDSEASGNRPLQAERAGATKTLEAGYRDLDYRQQDYRQQDYREMAVEDGIDWVRALRRYWYVLLLPTAIGLSVAFALFHYAPPVYRCSSKLMIESDAPSLLDSASGDILSGLPSADLLLAQLLSDDVLQQASASMAEKLDAPAVPQPRTAFSAELTESLEFEPEAGGGGAAGAMAFYLHVDHREKAFAAAGVTSLSDALEAYFSDRREDSIDELKQLIRHAKDKLMPELDQLEGEYEQFREAESNLAWDASGKLVNRFREKETLLAASRVELEREKDGLDVRLAAIQNAAARQRTNPIAVLEVVSHLMNADLDVPGQLSLDSEHLRPADTIEEDLRLKRLDIERSLVPLEVERDHFLAVYGEAHPTVQHLNQRIESTREKLQKLIEEEDARREELSLASLEQSKQVPAAEQSKRQEHAKFVVNSYVRGLRARQAVLQSQLDKLDAEIEQLREQAADLAVAERKDAMFQRKIARSQGLLSQVEEQMARVNLTDKGPSLRIKSLRAPNEPQQVAPVLYKYLGAGGMLGVLLGCGLIYVVESSSHTFHNPTEIAESLDVPILGQIPCLAKRDTKDRGQSSSGVPRSVSVVHQPNSVIAEAVRKIRTALFFEAARREARVIQVTSPLPEDGKSTVSANLAASIAVSGKSVVLVDADLRRPQTSKSFGLTGEPGITELLNDHCTPEAILHATEVNNLSVIPSGAIPANPAEAIAMPAFAELLGWLRRRYDYVIVDTPPLLVVSDAAIVSNLVDGVVFAFRVRRGCRPQTKEALSMLRSSDANVLGCIVNRVPPGGRTRYQASTASAYHYRSYHRETKRGDKNDQAVAVNVRSTTPRSWMEE
ncbi:polysaccharide biosynthesis tyrosine autokinase [Roseimaritima sediminicola]|uniref:BY-kinase domain-containing protein n=1 Tax=Roseimaritima sediminicola TaxID=2662066 RepID=UPI00138673BE|nr:polysaccharide biosynthesis tyrosine autokinase [Roseimaritima sediminicola]